MIWLVQLVFDCEDPDVIMQFWGQALEYRNPLVGVSSEETAKFRAEHPEFDGRGRIDDSELRRTPVYIQRVPEAKSGRNRVRLEVGAPDVPATITRLRTLGATDDGDALLDVEGNEFVVIAGESSDVSLRSVVIDAVDPERLLAFWSSATGYVPRPHALRCDPPDLGVRWTGDHFDVDGARVRHICGAGAAPGPARFDLTPGFRFSPTPHVKETKNRLHLDLNSTDVEADRERLVGLGASILRWDTDQVLADPEGNEFCLSGRPVASAVPL